jgi:pyruvate formate lyase activating enzyme
VVERDRPFYEQSGGGVTVGGGEPTFQSAFVSQLLSACHSRGIHTAVETCGLAPWDSLRRVLENADQVLFDIKHTDSARHKALTGAGNEQILANARRAAGMSCEFTVRFPLIPGCNSDPFTVGELGRFVRDELPQVHRIDILPYHSTGESKKQQLSAQYLPQEPKPLEKQDILAAQELLRSFGLEVLIV